jgi:hypothetical protein
MPRYRMTLVFDVHENIANIAEGSTVIRADNEVTMQRLYDEIRIDLAIEGTDLDKHILKFKIAGCEKLEEA